MRAGSLNRRVTIQEKSGGFDEIGQPLPDTWSDVATVWANVRFLNGTESIKADAEASIARASIRIRYRPGLNAGMRAKYGDMIFEVRAVLPDVDRREHVDLVCEVINVS